MMELNREEIIKALECCSLEAYGHCSGCPYIDGDMGCSIRLHRDSLDIIRELIEERGRCLEALSELSDNIGLLKDKAQTDAVRKFAEYLKEQSFNCDPGNGFSFDAIDVDELDDYVKEFLEE